MTTKYFLYVFLILNILSTKCFSAHCIIQQPRNDTACVGGTASFSVTNSTSVSYQWQVLNGTWLNLTNDTTGNLTITNVNSSLNNTWYRCILSGSSCQDTTDSVRLTVNPLPSASVIPSTAVCLGNSVSIGTSSVSGSTYSWASSPSGFTSTSANPSVNPSGTTAYTLTETITTTGCTKSNSVTITVNPLPVSAFSTISSTQCLTGNSFSFTDISSISSGSVTGWAWDFGDGNSSVTQNTTHSYSVSGIYTVKLTASSNKGCANNTSKSITVYPASTVIFTVNSNAQCLSGNSFVFTDNSSISSGTITSWTWDFGDGATSLTQNPKHSYISAGTYKVILRVTNNYGCTDTVSKSVTINPNPNASVVSNSAICSGNSILIGASSVSGSTYSWTSSPSGFTSTSSNPLVNPNGTTSYTLTETITATGCAKSNSVTVTINSLPSASVISNTSICSGNSISIGSSSISGSTYSWSSSPSGFTSTVSNPTVSPSSTANYTLTETNSNSCVKSNSVTITVNNLPIASVAANTGICSGATPIPIGAIAVSGSSYSWSSTPSGFSSTSANPSVSPTSTSSYTLTETNSNGCAKSNSLTVTVNALPSASIVSNTAICLGNSLSIGALSVSGSTYSWASSPGGFSSTSANPSVSPTSTATYTLTETNSNSCVKSNSVTIIVNALPSASVGSNTSICSGGTYSVGAAVVSGSSYSWISSPSGFSSTISNPTVSPTSTTAYTLTETNASGCIKANSVNITVNALPSASVVPNTSICKGNSITIGATAVTGSSYSWSSTLSGFSSTLSNPSVSPSSTATYTLTETNSNSCIKSNSVIITVNALPVAAVASASTICAGTFTSIGSTAVTGSSYSWTSSPSGFTSTSSNPSVNPSGTTTYTITETNSNSCVKSNSVTITVNPLPVSAFTSISSSQCLTGNSFSFTDQSTISSGSVAAWSWNFGDGNTSLTQNTSHTYTASGIYTVKLIATSSKGCVDTISQSITVYPASSATFSINTITQCLTGNNFAFTDKSTVSTGKITAWSWDFGDGYASLSQNPTHAYSFSGTYKVILKVTNNFGCTDTTSKSVSVYAQPSSAFSVNSSSQCFNGNNYIFTDKSVISSGSIAWSWDFGDSKGSTSENTSHSYASPGTYTVKLTVTSDKGCITVSSMILTVFSSSIPSFSINSNAQCLSGNSFVFTDKSNVSTGKIIGWAWDFGDGNTSLSQNPSHTYSPNGIYKIILKTTTNNGCSDTVSKSITVYPQPTAIFNAISPQCLTGNSFNFSDASTVSSGSIVSRSWDFGDASTSTLKNPNHTYSSPSYYLVTLTSTSDHSCTSTTTSHTITVYPNPVALFTVNDNAQCLDGNSFSFADASSVVSGTINSRSWSFGDGGTSTMQNPTHPYSKSGTFTVSLTILSDRGCSDTFKYSVNVYTKPIAGFKIKSSAMCLSGNNFTFTDTSKGTITSWEWDFGDATASLSQNPNHTYNSAGSYKVILKVTTNTGCTDTVSKMVTVYPQPIAEFTVNQLNQCYAGNSFTFNDKSIIASGNIKKWVYTFGDGNNNSSQNPVHSYAGAGVDTVTLTVNSNNSCINTSTTTITVYLNPKINKVSNSTQICLGGSASLFANANETVTYNWLPLAGLNLPFIQNPIASPLKTTAYTVTAINANGCSDSATVKVVVNPLPKAIGDTIAVCLGGKVTLTAKGGSAYLWATGDTSKIRIVNPLSTSLYRFTAFNSFNCSDTSHILVNVNPLPVVYLDTAISICNGGTGRQLNASGGTQYTWHPAIGLTNAHIANPVANPANNTKYTVLVTNTNGCVDSASEKVNVITPPKPVIHGDSLVCKNAYWAGYKVAPTSNGLNWIVQNGTILVGQWSNKIRIHWSDTASSGLVQVIEQMKDSAACSGNATYKVVMRNGQAPNEATIIAKANNISTNILLCPQCTFKIYKWGYEPKVNPKDTEIFTYSDESWCLFNGIDPTNYYYWAYVGDDSTCLTKSYFNPPTNTSGINQATVLNDYLNIYPNPNNGNLVLQYRSIQQGKIHIEVKSLLGKEVFQNVSDKDKDEFDTNINLGSLRAGIYFIEIECGNSKSIKKFCIINE